MDSSFNERIAAFPDLETSYNRAQDDLGRKLAGIKNALETIGDKDGKSPAIERARREARNLITSMKLQLCKDYAYYAKELTEDLHNTYGEMLDRAERERDEKLRDELIIKIRSAGVLIYATVSLRNGDMGCSLKDRLASSVNGSSQL